MSKQQWLDLPFYLSILVIFVVAFFVANEAYERSKELDRIIAEQNVELMIKYSPIPYPLAEGDASPTCVQCTNVQE